MPGGELGVFPVLVGGPLAEVVAVFGDAQAGEIVQGTGLWKMENKVRKYVRYILVKSIDDAL